MITVSEYDLVVDRYPMVHIHELLACRDLQVPEARNLDRYRVIDIGDYEYDNAEVHGTKISAPPPENFAKWPRNFCATFGPF